jgi:hypothetical protein
MSGDLWRRRALLLSLGGALGLALPTALIASEEAEAQNTEDCAIWFTNSWRAPGLPGSPFAPPIPVDRDARIVPSHREAENPE